MNNPVFNKESSTSDSSFALRETANLLWLRELGELVRNSVYVNGEEEKTYFPGRHSSELADWGETAENPS